MATAEQLKALIRSHLSDDSERFNTIALQMAAYEAQQGHGALAHDIREIVDKSRQTHGPRIVRFPVDLRGLVLTDEPDTPKASLVMPQPLLTRVDRVVEEYRQQQKLKAHGLSHRRKLLLVGPPGTGKTMTARVLAHELRLALHTVQVDKLVTKFMGETSAKLRQIFDLIQQAHGVYLFDEFDAIGGERMLENDVGEMRRVLNSFLQFIELDTSDSLIVAATNSPRLLDRALYRRFDDVLYYAAPEEEDRKRLIQNVLGTFYTPGFAWTAVLRESEGLSHAEIDMACRDAIKESILSDKEKVTAAQLRQMLAERRGVHSETREYPDQSGRAVWAIGRGFTARMNTARRSRNQRGQNSTAKDAKNAENCRGVSEKGTRRREDGRNGTEAGGPARAESPSMEAALPCPESGTRVKNTVGFSPKSPAEIASRTSLAFFAPLRLRIFALPFLEALLGCGFAGPCLFVIYPEYL